MPPAPEPVWQQPVPPASPMYQPPAPEPAWQPAPIPPMPAWNEPQPLPGEPPVFSPYENPMPVSSPTLVVPMAGAPPAAESLVSEPPAVHSAPNPAPANPWAPPELLPQQPVVVLDEETHNSIDDETVVDPEVVDDTPRLVLDDGEEIALNGPVIMGRAPRASRYYPQARLQTIDDTSKRLSKTHLLVIPRDGEILVRDLRSRNGVVFAVDGHKFRIEVGVEVPIPQGAEVHIGGRSFTVHEN